MTLRKGEDTLHLKEEALDHTLWRARFGLVIRQTTKRMKVIKCKPIFGIFVPKFL